MAKIVIDKNRCKACELCVVTCPMGIIEIGREMNDLGELYAVQTDESKCTGCKFCGMICPDAAIKVYK